MKMKKNKTIFCMKNNEVVFFGSQQEFLVTNYNRKKPNI